MKKATFLKRAKAAARQNERLRKDPRFVRVIGLLKAKGFLFTNLPIREMPRVHITVQDAIWAGENVEPRILEVLPAAVHRLKRNIQYDPEEHPDLRDVIEAVQNGKEATFRGIAADKIAPWFYLDLRDKRYKIPLEHKRLKTFRLNPRLIDRLKLCSKRMGKSETQVIEELIAGLPGPGTI